MICMTSWMSKITFRADDDLINRLEEFDASKSQVMREALRAYLDSEERSETPADASDQAADTESIDALIADRVDALIADRLDQPPARRQPQDVNVNINLDADTAAVADEQPVDGQASDTGSDSGGAGVSHGRDGRKTASEGHENAEADGQSACSQCGETVSSSHVYCPNCGEKASRRVFCDCGDEIRSDWGFCPGCGRRTPAADVLDHPSSSANKE